MHALSAMICRTVIFYWYVTLLPGSCPILLSPEPFVCSCIVLTYVVIHPSATPLYLFQDTNSFSCFTFFASMCTCGSNLHLLGASEKPTQMVTTYHTNTCLEWLALPFLSFVTLIITHMPPHSGAEVLQTSRKYSKGTYTGSGHGLMVTSSKIVASLDSV